MLSFAESALVGAVSVMVEPVGATSGETSQAEAAKASSTRATTASRRQRVTMRAQLAYSHEVTRSRRIRNGRPAHRHERARRPDDGRDARLEADDPAREGGGAHFPRPAVRPGHQPVPETIRPGG